MKPKSEISLELYQKLLDRGYQERFCDLVTQNLNTDFTAQRMIFYLSHYYETQRNIAIGSRTGTAEFINSRKTED